MPVMMVQVFSLLREEEEVMQAAEPEEVRTLWVGCECEAVSSVRSLASSLSL